MASVQAPLPAAGELSKSSQDLSRLAASSTPIEMSTMSSAEVSHIPRSPIFPSHPQDASYEFLPSANNSSHHPAPETAHRTTDTQQAIQLPLLADLNFDFGSHSPQSPISPDQPAPPIDATSSPLAPERVAPAIGSATDKPAPLPKESEVYGPVLFLTLLLTTGARHPFKLDEKYLKKRSVEVEANNPVNLSLYQFKELILRDWREEWEPKPSSPEAIRLISMGKLLGDKSKLADFGFKNGSNPHIIHMTVKPQEIADEEDAKSSARDREGHERNPGCRCIIQ